MRRRIASHLSMFGTVAVALLAAGVAPAAEDEKKPVKGDVSKPTPVRAGGYITKPAPGAPVAGPVLRPTAAAYPITAYPAPAVAATAPGCTTPVYTPVATAHSSPPFNNWCLGLARMAADGQLMVQHGHLKPVPEIRKEEADVIGADGQPAKAPTCVIQVRYVAEMQEKALPQTFDVYKMDGTKLSEVESREALKEERAVVFSDIAQAAVIMSPLGRKFCRDDVLVIVLRNDARAVATPRVSATPVCSDADSLPNFTGNGEIPFNGNSIDSRAPQARPIAQPPVTPPQKQPLAPPPPPQLQAVPPANEGNQAGYIVPDFSAEPAARVEELIHTPEGFRQILEEWRRIWLLDQPDHRKPFRTQGGII